MFVAEKCLVVVLSYGDLGEQHNRCEHDVSTTPWVTDSMYGLKSVYNHIAHHHNSQK